MLANVLCSNLFQLQNLSSMRVLWHGMSNFCKEIHIETFCKLPFAFINRFLENIMHRNLDKAPPEIKFLSTVFLGWVKSLQWHHNDCDGVSNHQLHDYLLNRLFMNRLKKTPKLCVTVLCDRNSPVTGEFPAQRASNAENVSIWWRHHVLCNTPGHDIHRSRFVVFCCDEVTAKLTHILLGYFPGIGTIV